MYVCTVLTVLNFPINFIKSYALLRTITYTVLLKRIKIVLHIVPQKEKLL